jgi:uncharacterized membrane protein
MNEKNLKMTHRTAEVLRNHWDLVAVVLVSALMVPLAMTQNPLRIIFGLFFTLFFPGYAFVSFLFPKNEIEVLERIALSLGLSVAITPLIGLGLNFSFGIRVETILPSLAIFNTLFSILAIKRRESVAEPFVPKVKFEVDFKSMSLTEKLLTIALISAIFISIFTLFYVLSNPRQGESFTEFYILGPKGKASDYPTRLFVNQSGSVIIGIVNHEYRTVNYTVEIWLAKEGGNFSKVKLLDSFAITLDHVPVTQNWTPQFEKLYNFSIKDPGKYKMFFLLLKDMPPKKPEDFGSGEDRIRRAIEGEIQSLILNVEVIEL